MSPNPKSPSLSLWFQLYFVFAALLGLLLTSIGTSQLINTVLSSTILKIDQRGSMPPPMPATTQPIIDQKTVAEATPDQKAALEQWQKDYSAWQETEKNRDYEAENRKRSLTQAIAMLVTGLPILLFHAKWIWKKAV